MPYSGNQISITKLQFQFDFYCYRPRQINGKVLWISSKMVILRYSLLAPKQVRRESIDLQMMLFRYYFAAHALILTLLSGGLGLNLTAANKVIIFDGKIVLCRHT